MAHQFLQLLRSRCPLIHTPRMCVCIVYFWVQIFQKMYCFFLCACRVSRITRNELSIFAFLWQISSILPSLDSNSSAHDLSVDAEWNGVEVYVTTVSVYPIHCKERGDGILDLENYSVLQNKFSLSRLMRSTILQCRFS